MIQSLKNIAVPGSDSRLMATDVFIKQAISNAPVVIYVHGFNGFKDWGNFDLIANQFAEAGFCFIKMNLSHNGTTLDSPEDFVDLEAFGHNNYTKELFDVSCILNWISESSHPFASQINLQSISLVGHSRGGGIAILKSAEDLRIKKLVTWASISECKTPWGSMSTSKLDQWKQDGVMFYTNKRTNLKLPLYYQLLEDYMSNSARLDIQSAIQKLDIPILICHGTNDPAVNISSALQLHQWQPESTLFTFESDHVFGRTHPWLHNHLPAPMQDVLNQTLEFLSESN